MTPVSDAERPSSTSTGVVVIGVLLVVILLVLIKIYDKSETAPTREPSSEETFNIDPVVKAKCADLQAQIDTADDRAYASTTGAEQTHWADQEEALARRYYAACDEYDTWL